MQDAIEKSNIDREAIDIAGCLPPLVASYIASEALPFDECVVQFQKLIKAQELEPHYVQQDIGWKKLAEQGKRV